MPLQNQKTTQEEAIELPLLHPCCDTDRDAFLREAAAAIALSRCNNDFPVRWIHNGVVMNTDMGRQDPAHLWELYTELNAQMGN